MNERKMQLEVISDAYELLLLIFKSAPKIPKVHRPSLMSKLENQSLDMFIGLKSFEFTKREKKMQLISSIYASYDKMKILIEILNGLELIQSKVFFELTASLNKIGKKLADMFKTYAKDDV